MLVGGSIVLEQIISDPLIVGRLRLRTRFFVKGTTRTKGSVTPICTANGKGRIKHSSADLKNWARTVYFEAVGARNRAGVCKDDGPVAVALLFLLGRPKCHFLKDGVTLASDAPLFHTQPKDVDKLFRAVGDALTDCLYTDDGQTIFGCQLKRWVERGEEPGVWISFATVAGARTAGDLQREHLLLGQQATLTRMIP